MNLRLACIVEGDGEVEALPVLLRRICAVVAPGALLQIVSVLRRGKSLLLKEGVLERDVELLGRKVRRDGAVLILLDSDDDCPKLLAPSLLSRAQHARGDISMSVVIAHREYEAWFLAAAPSLAGKRGLRSGLMAPVDPEAIRGAKEWISDHMEQGRRYSQILDQPALSQLMSLELARNASSFDKLWREVERLVKNVAKS